MTSGSIHKRRGYPNMAETMVKIVITFPVLAGGIRIGRFLRAILEI